MAAAQAGSLRVPGPLSWVSKDLEALEPHGAFLTRIAETFATRVAVDESRRFPKSFVIPTYAVWAPEDVWVDRMSAGLSLPAEQKKPVRETHESIVKPTHDGNDAYTWVLERLRLCLPDGAATAEHKDSSAPDLVISTLSSAGRLLPLPGREPILTSKEPIFTGGFRVRFSIAHNRATQEPISVTGVHVIVDEFQSGYAPEYRYRLNLDRIIGRRIAEVRTFTVCLRGSSISEATWVDSKREPFPARSANLLDVNPPITLVLEGDSRDSGEELDITVTANQQGLYKVRFLFAYFVQGKDHAQSSPAIRFYFDE
jgi:hypothetical protein